MAASDKDPVIPGLIGNFNIPKSVIENKVDVLTFLELLVRKGMVTAEELDDIRGSVVAHLNAAYPELELSYSTPEGGNQGPFNPPAAAAPKAGLANNAFQTPNPLANQSIASASMMAPMPEETKPTDTPAEAEASEPAAAPAASPNPDKPLWVQAPPPRFIK